MLRTDLRKYIVPTIPTGVFLLLVTVLVWFSDIYISHSNIISGSIESISAEANTLFLVQPLISKAISLLLTVLNAFLISQLNDRFAILRTRSFMPVLTFAILMAVWHETHYQAMTNVSLTLFLLSMFSLFRVFRNRNAAEPVFLTSFLIATSSLIYEVMILYIPLIWIGLSYLYSFSFRNFLASIIGVLTPWIIFVSIKLVQHGDFVWLYNLQNSFYITSSVLDHPLNKLIYIGAMVILCLISLFNISANIHQDSMQSRALISFNSWILVASAAFTLIFSNMFVVFLPVLALSLSIMISQPLTINKSRIHGIIFAGFVLINILFVVSNIILLPG